MTQIGSSYEELAEERIQLLQQQLSIELRAKKRREAGDHLSFAKPVFREETIEPHVTLPNFFAEWEKTVPENTRRLGRTLTIPNGLRLTGGRYRKKDDMCIIGFMAYQAKIPLPGRFSNGAPIGELCSFRNALMKYYHLSDLDLKELQRVNDRTESHERVAKVSAWLEAHGVAVEKEMES